jgi:hypothetical protein
MLLKDTFSLYIDIMATGKGPIQVKDVEALLSSNGIKPIKLDEKEKLSNSTKTVFNVALNSKDQALKLLSIEGQVTSSLSDSSICQAYSG